MAENEPEKRYGDDTIWVDDTTNRSSPIYHTDPDCSNFPTSPNPKKIELLNGKWRECKICARGLRREGVGHRRSLRAAIEAGDIDLDEVESV